MANCYLVIKHLWLAMIDLSIVPVMEIIRHKIFAMAWKIAKSTKASCHKSLMVCSIINFISFVISFYLFAAQLFVCYWYFWKVSKILIIKIIFLQTMRQLMLIITALSETANANNQYLTEFNCFWFSKEYLHCSYQKPKEYSNTVI